MITVAEAQARILALAGPPQVEEVPLEQAAGRWLAAPLAARRDAPPFDASAMDGYAVAGAVAAGARFRVVGQAAAGRPWAGKLEPGQALRLFTGTMVPEGAGAVLIQEDAEVAGDVVTVRPGHDTARYIRPRGQDFAAGFTLSPRRLRPTDLALIAAMGFGAVPVARRPVVAVVSTGDELVPPGAAPGPGQIAASNGVALAALAEAQGAVVRRLPIARDDPAHLAAVLRLASGADLIVTSGGASVGDHDLVAPVARELGLQAAFHRVAMRPGKPLMAGRMGSAAMIGLPGNPVSSIVCGLIFMCPLIRAMQGDPAPLPVPLRAELAEDVGPTGPRAHYMRARLTAGAGPLPSLTPFPSQDSGLLRTLAEADALMIRPQGDGPRRAGEAVDYIPL